MKVDYIVGAFLSELDTVSHNLPEKSIENNTEDKIYPQVHLHPPIIKRKTEDTTKSKIKSTDNQ